ncbi:DUF1275 domain [Cordyceps militaris]|uniref:DUF1275 domain n=1 Tax=Cordyceps militaris TaxID=73501 RepID=A0A2H4SGS6_CORMI|nr:DUF1275 domain [Cordyceps militaris]
MAGYGSTAASRPAHGSDPEAQPLLGKLPSSPGAGGAGGITKIRMTLHDDVSLSWSDVMLLFCYVVTGLLDSASTQVWGAFVSMQTGNTVFVALGIASLFYPPVSPRLYRSGISLLAFCVGSFLFARFHRLVSPTRRWVLCASFAAQALLTAAAALVVSHTPPPAGDDAVDWTVLLPLALIAFQSCGQAVASRALRHNALTSVVLTSIYCDLFSDQHLFRLDNVDRNRRAAAPLLLLLGAVVGGIFAHSPVGIQGALWTAAALKLVMVVIWFFWPEEPTEDDD